MSGRTFIINGAVLTMDDDDSYHRTGHVVLEGDRIIAVARNSERSLGDDEEEGDGTDGPDGDVAVTDGEPAVTHAPAGQDADPAEEPAPSAESDGEDV